MTPNAAIAERGLALLLGHGVTEFVICAGARNVPLAASLLEIRESAGLTIWRHFDERTAAFFALGRAKKSGRPVAVCTTSGTAAAELLPATIEAHYSGIPLVLVTADRPLRFRGSGAPQAIEQVGLLEPHVSLRIDAQEAGDLDPFREWIPRNPAHLNLCFEEPTTEDRVASVAPIASSEVGAEDASEAAAQLASFVSESGGLAIIVGELPEPWREPVGRFLEGTPVPVWTEATSGLREDGKWREREVVRENGLADLDLRKVLRIGGVPSLRFWRDLEELPGIEVLSISPRPFSGLARSSELLVTDHFPDISLTQLGRVADETLLDAVESAATGLESSLRDFSGSEPAMVRALSEAVPAEALVYLGNSLPIREWNLAASRDTAHPRAFASRGANGIDGQVATYLGLSADEEEAWGIFGDLTALYDLNSLSLLGDLPAGRRRIVVLNNGGGRIFSRLRSMATMSPEEKQVTENRHEIGFANWAAMWGLGHVTWRAGDSFPDLPAESLVLEVLPDEAATEDFWKALG